MLKSFLFRTSALVLLLVAVPIKALGEPSIYWTDFVLNQIIKANRDGTNPTPIVSLGPTEQPESIAIDDVEEKIYWVSFTSNWIRRANLDGSNVELVTDAVNGPLQIQVEPLERKIYWTSGAGVFRSDLDGLNQENVVAELISDDWSGLALEPISKSMFLSEFLSNNITFASYGSPPPLTPTVFHGTSEDVRGLAIGGPSLSLAFADQVNNAVLFSTIAFFDPIPLIFIDPPGVPQVVAFDFPSSFIYWSESGTNVIRRQDGPGNNPELIASSPAPFAIALDCGPFAPDGDSDGAPNCSDKCPVDSLKTAPGSCGCGISDIDSDGDGTADCLDQCSNDAQKTVPGSCGCGIVDIDSDGDGTPDCLDQCPNDAQKTTPGSCGCGLDDSDSDSDGVISCIDECPLDPLKSKAAGCGCGIPDIDSDGDGAFDCSDECPADELKLSALTCGCGLRDNLTDKGTILCSEFRILTPLTSIIDPPGVVVKKKSVTIIMEKFAAVSDKRVKPKSAPGSDKPETSEAKKKSKLTSQYSVFLNRVGGGPSAKKISAQSKRNTLTFKNLQPGKYNVSYRVEIVKNGKIAGRTNKSPVASFVIE